MSELVKVSNLKEAIAECPICTEFFNEDLQIPRRMPCCSQAICQHCLETFIGRNTTFSCPMCKTQHSLPGGVKSLAKEMVILRFLEALKTERNAVPLCTDCPDDNRAKYKCDNCGVYLCQPCLTAHKGHKATRGHKITTFEEMSSKWQSRPSTIKRKKPSKLTEMLEKVSERAEQLVSMMASVDKSKKAAESLINKRCDELVDEVQKRREILLSQLNEKAEAETRSIKKALDSHEHYQEKLKKAPPEEQSALLQESPSDLKQQRVGLIFSEVYLQQILEVVRSAGMVRVVTFTPAERSSDAVETAIYNAVEFSSAEFYRVPRIDDVAVLGKKKILCLPFEWETYFSSKSITITPDIVTNAINEPRVPNHGLQLKGRGRAYSTHPVVIKHQRILFQCRIGMALKKVQKERVTMSEISLIKTPIDTGKSTPGVIDVNIRVIDKIYVVVAYDGKILKKIPIARNEVGVSFEVCYCVLLDGVSKSIHVINSDDGSVVTSANHVHFNSPLWLMASVRSHDRADTTIKLQTGRKLILERHVKENILSLL